MKRKGDINADLGASGVKKTRAWGKGKAKLDVEPSNWPLYFQNLNKVKFHSNLRRALTESSEQLSIQALNTVLAFVSSRKQLATTFPVIRSSVEGLLKQTSYQPPPSLTPAALKKLVEKRNQLFCKAVEELILATPINEDPVDLLQAASRDHIPIKPQSPQAVSDKCSGNLIPEPADRPSIESVIDEIISESWYKDQIVERKSFDAKEGTLGTVDPPLSESIMQALRDSRKISSLYAHQAAAITALAQGKNVIVSTSTASGKSVIYQALAQDQRAALEQLLWACPGLQHIKVATYDGDTPQEQRAVIRETASIIFTNFDMIHASILPHENNWRTFLKNLKIVAVDELHYYSDLFGSHVAQVMRRFRRVCAAVGNRRTRFVSCSATISQPKQHMQSIFGVDDIEAITEDCAPSGCKNFLVWNPPLVEEFVPALGRISSMSEATGLMRFLMKRGVRVILFCKAMKTIRADLSAEGRLDILERVMAYRGGYSQQDRRRIEAEAFSGNLLGIVATNALELGVDIGVLDGVIMLGFPFGIANFRQQAGRAGRRARDSLVVFVAENFPIDQHYVQNPQELFEKSADDLIVDLESKVILEAHLQCAGQEMPLSKADTEYFGPLMVEICETQLSQDKDDVTKGGGHAKIIEEVELSRALFEIYEGGVFIHQGLTFIIKEVSHDSKMAKVIRADVNWITSPRNGVILDQVDLETAPWQREATGLWLDIPKSIFDLLQVKGISLAGGIHSAEHAFLNRFAMARDLKTECKLAEKENMTTESKRKRPARLIFYDAQGRSGIAAKAFDHVFSILREAEKAIEACECEEGCYKCVQSPLCRDGNQIFSKIGAQLILRSLVGLEIDPESIPVQNEGTSKFQTVVEASYVRPLDGTQVEIVDPV
ncbi:hypothetical protein HWV62_18928 [Athelia sp. TMB]|nr:hypothetical protein HWV62_18928 [Athelia sp. TMB]